MNVCSDIANGLFWRGALELRRHLIANGLFWRGALELRRHLRLACASPSRVAALWQVKTNCLSAEVRWRNRSISGAWTGYRKARAPKPTRLGRCQQVLTDALDKNLAIGVRAAVVDHLGRAPTRAELTAARRAAHSLAASDRARVLHVPGADADANTGDPKKSLEVLRPDSAGRGAETEALGRSLPWRPRSGRVLRCLGEAELGQEFHLVEVEPVVRDDAIPHPGHVTLADTNLPTRGGDGLTVASLDPAAVRPREVPLVDRGVCGFVLM